ncbi:phage tail tip lysozyme [Psychrobacter sanguinis]|uniref:phage tail tip lysozyme n=1 Tax=Psychrobacter sanguinis TaxID=861445 RepID=UPI00020C7E8B|nr:phage tail tip lysozyme [Psychrobacter sanguinis]EGK11762.1 CHAP domain protein [Psychrobacter sp. 1501(2011)]MCD9151749.1 phage tail tip lysozyme [Psychrobacter sanguinis]
METYLNYDDQGFIVGTKRLESGIKSISEDTQEIIQILKSQNQINQTVLNRIAKSNERIANKKSMRIQGVVPTYDPNNPDRNNASQPGTQGQEQSKQQHKQDLSSASQTVKSEKRAAGSKDGGALSNVTSNATVKSGSATNRADIQRDSGSNDVNRSTADRGREGLDTTNNVTGIVPSATGATRKANNPTGKNGREKKKNDSERDELGRFTAKEKSLFDSLSKIAKSGRTSYGSYGSAQDIDPLIASMNEVKDVASPLFNMATQAGKMGGMAGKAALRAGRFSFSKYKSLKRKEPLPKEQARHNKQNEETLGEILKRMPSGEGSLLGRLGRGLGLLGGGGKGKGRGKDKSKGKGKGVKAILSGAGAAILGAGKSGGKHIGNAAKALGKTRVLTPLATAIGAGSLASRWDELDNEERTAGIGSIAGGGAGAMAGGAIGSVLIPVPVVGTAIGAAVGGWIGSEGGEVLGRTASPHIKSWTDSIKAYNLPQKMQTKWETGLAPVLSKLSEAAGGMKSWLSRMGDGVSSFFSGDSGIGAPTQAAANASDYAIKNAAYVSLGACAKYVNDAFRAQGLQASGNGVDAAKNLINLNKGKFQEVAYSEGYTPQVGDVMSMPSNSKSKHNYGHVAVYTKEGWVSDYKQGEKYGNTAAPNKDYYEEIKSGKIKPTIARMIPDGTLPTGSSTDVSSSRLTTQEQKAKRDEAMQYFMSQGWTKEQAAGIVGNIQKESMFNYKALGDKNKQGVYQAYGLAQWHPDRQADFKKAFGKDIKQASYKEQLAFINYELTKGDEKAAGNKLKKAKTAGQAGAIVSEFYERPKAVEAEKRERAKIAEGIYNNTAVQSVQQKTKTTNSVLGVNVGGLANNFIAGNTPAYQPASLPKYESAKQSLGLDLGSSILKNVFNIPDMPSFRLPLAGGGLDKPIIVQSNNESIGQNVSDRDLAHAITGGIGMSRAWD